MPVPHHSCPEPAIPPRFFIMAGCGGGLMYYVYKCKEQQAHSGTQCTLSNSSILIITGGEKGEFQQHYYACVNKMLITACYFLFKRII